MSSGRVGVRFRLSSDRVNFGLTKLGSGSVSDRLRFGSGKLRVNLTRVGFGTGRVEVSFGYGSGRNRNRLSSNHITFGLWPNL